MSTAVKVAEADNCIALRTERDRLEAALKLAERERQFLGFEIHDGVVQDLAAAAMLLEGAGRQATFASGETQESFETGLRLLRESIMAARRLIRGTTAVEPDNRGLAPAIQRLVDKFRIDHGLPVTFVGEAHDLSWPVSMQHLLLRIVHEALYNAWKHAQANEVEVQLRVCDQRLELAIRDNGCGFDPERVAAGHFGLEGIRERARLLNAELLFDTAPQHGTRVVVSLPLPEHS